jgi:FPC/CPF motif-containing protein YcgG
MTEVSPNSGSSPIRRVVYTSVARDALSRDELDLVMIKSYRNNYVDGVRGRLFTIGGTFLQILEGVPAAVDEVLARIRADPRHHSIVQHVSVDDETFACTSWSMDATPIGTDPAVAMLQLQSLLPPRAFDACRSALIYACALAATTPAMTDMSHIADPAAVALVQRFEQHIKDSGYPCVGAKSAIAKQQMTAYVGRSLASAWDDVAIVREIIRFAHQYAVEQTIFRTFVTFFPDSPAMDEAAFEKVLWDRITSLQAKDEWLGHGYDPSVSPDPASPKFSLSFGGQAFFVVGMHPNASRPARRFDVPVMVFNLHDQFEKLRAEGRYDTIRKTIINRDVALAGSVNPMLARHGEASEARQYSGRLVGPDWECPYPGRADAAATEA